jgi:hypothetical protein
VDGSALFAAFALGSDVFLGLCSVDGRMEAVGFGDVGQHVTVAQVDASSQSRKASHSQ